MPETGRVLKAADPLTSSAAAADAELWEAAGAQRVTFCSDASITSAWYAEQRLKQ